MAKKSINILDKDYTRWVKELSTRYRKSQIKAAVKVNSEMLRYYWELGRDIVTKQAENKYGSNFYGTLSTDLKKTIPNAEGLSPSNIRYSKRFFQLYSPVLENLQQVAENWLSENPITIARREKLYLFGVEGNIMKRLIALMLCIMAVATFAAEDIKIVKVNDANFEKEVLQSKKPVILDITSTSCPPCLIMIPTLIGIAKNYPDIKIATVGIDEPGIDKIKASLPIQAFPTFFMVRDGKIVNQLVGAVKEEELLAALQYTPSKKPAAKPKKVKNAKRNMVCKTPGQFNGLKNLVTISFVFGDYEIENVDIVTDVFVPPEMNDRRDQMMEHVRASGKGEVEPTMTGFRIHIDNNCRFMKAMDMKRTSTYGEMRAGLELQGFNCQ